MSGPDSSRLPRTEKATAASTYRLNCNDCSFETAVEGDCYDALDVADAHQEEYGGPIANHFVNFSLDTQVDAH